MAEQMTIRGAGSGPGNKLIATTLLELLAVRGRAAACERATRALELGEGGLADASSWLRDDAIDRIFAAADVDATLARAVGHRLTQPDAMGFRLYGLGLATPEKTYRRVQALLPRERQAACWEAEAIGEGIAWLLFRTHERDAREGDEAARGRANRIEQASCALRVGQLEAIPGLFGLLPARVRETACIADGAPACRYQVSWQRGSRSGLRLGGSAGLAFAAAIGAAVLHLDLPLVLCGLAGLLCVGLGCALGRVFDLHLQLQAVAGARRGHLALFDQVDDALATKLDALARVDAELGGSDAPTYRSSAAMPISGGGRSSGRSDREIHSAAREIHAAAGDLECWFEEQATDSATAMPYELDDERGRVREIREWAARIVEWSATQGDPDLRSVDLGALVDRAVATARPVFGTRVSIEIDRDDDLTPVPCEPVQIEQVVVQLLRNAVDASIGIAETPEVLVTLRNVARGVELAVEDRGVGIESGALEEVFDPFFGERPLGVDDGFGLPVCLRIVERHAGELRIESEDRPGTRVCILLPVAADAETASGSSETPGMKEETR